MRTLAAAALVLSTAACGQASSPKPEASSKRSERESDKIDVAVMKAACGQSLAQRADGVAEVADVTQALNGDDGRYGHDVPLEVYEMAEEIKRRGCP
jgi:hypothetical protein